MFPSKLEQNQLKASIASSYNKLYGQFSAKELQDVGNYKLLKVVGEGSFGKVYLASHRLTHQKVVLKMGSKHDPNVVREVFYHRQFDYVYITRLYEVIVTENNVWMALEYCPGRELYEYLLSKKHISIPECARLFSQIVGAVYYAHSMKCVHRDLKLENILLDKKGQAKLTDFGFTRECATRGILETVCGTTVYMAPELIERKPYEGYKTDMWSLGVILYTMVHGTMPFDEDDEIRTKRRIVVEEPAFDSSLINADGKDLITNLLNKDPQQRLSAKEVLMHPFLHPYGASVLEKTEKIIKRQSNSPKNFNTKLERRLLKKLKQTGFDTQGIKHSVNKRKCDSLSGMWYLLLEKEKRSDQHRHPKRSRSVLSVKKVFDASTMSRKSTEELKKLDPLTKATSLKRIMSMKSDSGSVRQPHNISQSMSTKDKNESEEHVCTGNCQRTPKKPNFFNKMSNFFKNKKQPGAALDNTSTSPKSDGVDKRKHNNISYESRKNSPQRSQTNSGGSPQHKNRNEPQPFQHAVDRVTNGLQLKIEEPMLKKFKSNTSSEMSRQTSLGNYDSEADPRSPPVALRPFDEGKGEIQRQRPNSVLSQHSEMSNDTYNSEYSTDGNLSNSKANSSMSSNANKSSGVMLSPNVESVDSSSFQTRATRRSMSIISSASSTSERSSRTDSFYEISTTSSPKSMDMRTMNAFKHADTASPRMNVGTHWLAKRGRSPVGRRGRLPKRNLTRKLLNHSSSAAQSVIQEEGSFEDDEEKAAALAVPDAEPTLPSAGKESAINSDPPRPVNSMSSPELPAVDRRPILMNMSLSFNTDSNPWSNESTESRSAEAPAPPTDNQDEHLMLGIADDEDNSLET
ncbi:LADA_0C07052g1_1 [Lachancea dasiensis]|uniref:non-specific serine/threonine protein kinase n=1 Tax=Lachancea dasiensis TaxID=1072105 RepID=A0A1G4IZU4_9SACH|nr:LADA_0C07052g1_1 [Lachancea dasiensis]